ncbi:coiled-coil domain-containing protein 17 [Chelmon rostratus]|uniref:coiled-coil domain-containing protein 17 n=1 Tax=Chelmon rostratus TaxID=109905 RepID=UPI001BED2ABB|nr:coiled-coil domain-containing protein 17 [Chelmon rostratus]
MRSHVIDFHADLFGAEQCSMGCCGELLAGLPQLSLEEKASLHCELTEKLTVAVNQMASGRASGIDDFSTDFYKQFFNTLGPDLHDFSTVSGGVAEGGRSIGGTLPGAPLQEAERQSHRAGGKRWEFKSSTLSLSVSLSEVWMDVEYFSSQQQQQQQSVSMEAGLICGDCNMMFHSSGLLEKHKALLCTGSDARHLRAQRRSSESLAGDKPGCADPKRTRTPDFVEVSGRQLGHSERLKEMREMATLHERQLALIHAHNQQLEQQREELAQQVSVLSEQSNKTHLESLLMELREQEERNEETLQQLAEHLHVLHAREVSVPADQPDPRKNKKMHHDSYELISCADGPLSTQIKALRRAYMQSGGSDPAIVARMVDLQAEARSLEENQPAAAGKSTTQKVPPQRDLSRELLAVEQENQRLEEEILSLQLARGRHQNYEGAVNAELELIQRENLLQISSLLPEMERSKEAPRPRRQPPPPSPPPHLLPLQAKTHIHAPLSLLQARSFSSPLGRCVLDLLDSLGPAPYDPVAGFVIFYDLVLGVDASQGALRLVAALYSEGQEVGLPTLLPPVRCLPGVSLPYAHSLTPRNYALLSVKQPVPRVQPSPSLCLVVEVQAATDLDVHGHEVFKLVSCGWTRMELFDQYNQLLSGHLRVPVRSLPIRPTLSLVQLNSVPQVGSMELCVRLVNGRDGDIQTLAKPDPTSTSHYKYPAVVSSHPATVHGNAALPVSAPKQQLSSILPFTAHQDPPPTEEASQSGSSSTIKT